MKGTLASLVSALLLVAAPQGPARAATDAELLSRLTEIPPEKGQTLDEYMDHLRTGGARVAKSATKEAIGLAAAETLERKSTTAQTAAPGSMAANPTMSHFLSLLQLGGSLPGTSDEADPVVTFKYNPIPDGTPLQWSLQVAIDSSPEPAKMLLDRVADGSRAAQSAAMAEEFGLLDDVTYSTQFSPRWRSGPENSPRRFFGRDWSLYQHLIGEIVGEALDLAGRDLDEAAPALEELTRHVERLPKDDPETFSEEKYGVDLELYPLELRCEDLPAADRERLLGLARRVAAAELLHDKSLVEWKLHEFGTLINNQPEIVFSASYKERDEYIGADAWSVALTYELGSRNVNTLLRRMREQRSKKEADRKSAPDLLLELLDPAAKVRENRVSLSIEYEKRSRWTATREYMASIPMMGGADDSELRTASIDVAEAKALNLSVHWRRNVFPKKGGIAKPLFDLAVTYSDVSDDPMRNDRLIAKAAWSVGFENGLTLPLTLTYANHGEYLGEQDADLSAHFGLSWKAGAKAGATAGQ